MLVEVIADTHGLLRPEARAALAAADVIIHAGDVGTPDVLDALARITAVTAVRGNDDHGASEPRRCPQRQPSPRAAPSSGSCTT